MEIAVIIFTTLLSSCLSHPAVQTWTLNEISTALELQTHPHIRQYLEYALNTIMFAMFTENEQDVLAVLRSPTGDRSWTRIQLLKAAHESSTNPNYKPFIKNALQYLKYMENDDKYNGSMEVTIPAMDISVWTVQDVEDAKLDPNTSASIWTLLKKADMAMQEELEKGEHKGNVTATLVTPVGAVPINDGVVREIIPFTKIERTL